MKKRSKTAKARKPVRRTREPSVRSLSTNPEDALESEPIYSLIDMMAAVHREGSRGRAEVEATRARAAADIQTAVAMALRSDRIRAFMTRVKGLPVFAGELHGPFTITIEDAKSIAEALEAAGR